jgi:hypothetical protein
MIAWKDLGPYVPCFGLFADKIYFNVETSGGFLP